MMSKISEKWRFAFEKEERPQGAKRSKGQTWQEAAQMYYEVAVDVLQSRRWYLDAIATLEDRVLALGGMAGQEAQERRAALAEVREAGDNYLAFLLRREQ